MRIDGEGSVGGEVWSGIRLRGRLESPIIGVSLIGMHDRTWMRLRPSIAGVGGVGWSGLVTRPFERTIGLRDETLDRFRSSNFSSPVIKLARNGIAYCRYTRYSLPRCKVS